MAIHVALHHLSHYVYDRWVSLAPQVIRLRPAPHCRTPILSYSLRVLPKVQFSHWQQDPQGNYLARLTFPEKTREFLVEVDLVAEMSVYNPFDFFLEPAADQVPFEYEPWLRRELSPFLVATPPGSDLRAFLDSIDRTPTRTIDFLVGLNQRLWREIRYLIRLEPGVQTPDETLRLRSGSCRDTGWLLVQVLRNLGLAARFVSGYLIQLTPDVKSLDGPSGPESDFTDLHAWAEVYLPGAGWVGFDPTSGLLAGEGHIPLACTPDPASAAPVTGAVDTSESTLDHRMTVRRIYESPRVTRPYSEEQWTEIETLGHRVDAELKSGDVRLTMGGEPTFVSIDDMDGPEWNTAALSPVKRQLGGALLRRLHAAFAPGGLLHYGQGKWYPGESLPRWALGCYWRRDGHPIWRDPARIADESRDYRHGVEQAREFGRALAERLEVNPEHLIPGYEDAWYYLWRERRLPTNVDPLESNLKDPEERARLARIFERGLERAVGFVLPIHRHPDDAGRRRWASGAWFVRPEHLFLIPGDSPMGYRLPLDSIPWVSERDYPHLWEPDPFLTRAPLSAPAADRRWQTRVPSPASPPAETTPEISASTASGHDGAKAHETAALAPVPGQSAPWLIRTAVCLEPRDGRLHVFLPPVETLEDYLDLIESIEDTAAALDMPVILEGTPPPSDPRLKHIKVTPDPGVIEVNLHPAESWDDLVGTTNVLYEEARLSRLGTEKFMLDGRHTGTGGGNHIVLGGPTPGDSPMLRRPDLLRSLLGYWHNHPSLSYLFSGLFIGPTSQHPRVDEARNDQLHELEIAFNQLPESGGCPPWLADRLFRNLLVDVTGNTHRTEFCIDKLYAPESASGRQGLVELRSFEMPPHGRMSLTQHLLLRSLIAWFWREPYRVPLVRWGTSLHDRFLLPHFVGEDLDDVVRDLGQAGYAMRREWFAPHTEFRFPQFGTVTYRGMTLELRQALEPWHVLGEQGAQGGAARYVDSSLERIQLKVNGMTGGRFHVACNGCLVPLQPAGVQGEFVAGVRYRAWQPPECLHPTLPVHAPLVFDLLDSWNRRSLGGCTYHVAHPGGRHYETFPVNAYEAESRRRARFFPIGHTAGWFEQPTPAINPDFPLTLDLRR